MTKFMETELIRVKNSAIPMILEAKSLQELEEIKLQFLGKSGVLTLVMKGIKDIPKEKRPEIGTQINEAKTIIEEAIKEKQKTLVDVKKATWSQRLDVTEP